MYSFIYKQETKEIIETNCDNVSDNNIFDPLFFDNKEFHNYHQIFAEKVYKVLFEREDKILGYCYIGKREKIAKLPYSAPFALLYPPKKWRIYDIFKIVKGLISFCNSIDCDRIFLTLPPEIYNPELINSLSTILFSEGFKVSLVDINQYFDFSTYENKESYLAGLMRMKRRNYNKAIKNRLEFVKVNDENFEKAYDVIEINRREMGYPLKISKSQMKDIINMKCLSSSCFLVNKDSQAIASAIVFDVTSEISQVIYWGDNPEFREFSPMALLTTEIFNYYKTKGKKYLDIGPSSDKGIINPGLFEFKQSIGCSHTIKLSFEFQL